MPTRYTVEASDTYSSQIASRISGYLFMYLLKNDIGHLTGEAGGYMIGGERYVPDVGFILKSKQKSLPTSGYNPNPPDLVVEVVSQFDTNRHINIKTANYLSAGTVVWIVYPHEQEVEVYIPGKAPCVYDMNDTLKGDSILPDFELPVKDIFPSS